MVKILLMGESCREIKNYAKVLRVSRVGSSAVLRNCQSIYRAVSDESGGSSTIEKILLAAYWIFMGKFIRDFWVEDFIFGLLK